MTRTLACLFVATTFLLPGNTFARDRGCSCGVSSPPVSCGTTISSACGCCGISIPQVGCGTVVSNGCASCSGGAYQNGSVIENNGGNQNIEGSGNDRRNDSPLDPDVLSDGTGDSAQLLSTRQGQRNANTERLWTDSSGRFTRLATFVRMEGTIVILKNAQGRTTRVDLQKLSTEDQRQANQLWKESTPGQLPSDHEPRVSERP